MCIRKRTLIRWGIVLVAVVLPAGAWGHQDMARLAAAQVDPADLAQQYIDALNAGDVDAVMELFADDAVYESPMLCMELGGECLSKESIRNNTEYLVALNARATISSSEVSGNTITGTLDTVSDLNRAAGVDRTVAPFSMEVTGDKISELHVIADVSDPGTAEAWTYMAAHSIWFALGPGRDGNQLPDRGHFYALGDRTVATIVMTPGPTGVRQPAHIHEGSCANLGAVVFSLQDIADGISGKVLDIPMSALQTGNFAVAVQKSHDEPDVLVACGDIPVAAEEAPEVAPAPAVEEEPVIAPAPAPVAMLPATGSGGLIAEDGSGTPTWWYALGAGGALLTVGGLIGLTRTRSRR